MSEVVQMSENSQKEPETANVGGVAGERLKSFIERVERLESEKKIIAEDIKEVYAEAKTTGFEPKIIRKIVSFRKMEVEKRITNAQHCIKIIAW